MAFNDSLNIDKSYYVATANDRTSFSQLHGEADADLVIVGAGCTGLSAALHAAKRGLKVVVLKGGNVGWSASAAMAARSYRVSATVPLGWSGNMARIGLESSTGRPSRRASSSSI